MSSLGNYLHSGFCFSTRVQEFQVMTKNSETHNISRIGWLRAAVLGANDAPAC